MDRVELQYLMLGAATFLLALFSLIPLPGADSGGMFSAFLFLHLFGYFVLAIIARHVLSEAYTVWTAIGFAAGTGFLLELMQLTVPFRATTPVDFAASAAGAALLLVVDDRLPIESWFTRVEDRLTA